MAQELKKRSEKRLEILKNSAMEILLKNEMFPSSSSSSSVEATEAAKHILEQKPNLIPLLNVINVFSPSIDPDSGELVGIDSIPDGVWTQGFLVTVYTSISKFIKALISKSNEELGVAIACLERCSGKEWTSWSYPCDTNFKSIYGYTRGTEKIIFEAVLFPEELPPINKTFLLSLIRDEKASQSTIVTGLEFLYWRPTEQMQKLFLRCSYLDRDLISMNWHIFREAIGDVVAVEMLDERPNLLNFAIFARSLGFNFLKLLESIRERSNDELVAILSYFQKKAEALTRQMPLNFDSQTYFDKDFFEILVSVKYILHPEIKALLDTVNSPIGDSRIEVVNKIKSIEARLELEKLEKKITDSKADVKASGHARQVRQFGTHVATFTTTTGSSVTSPQPQSPTEKEEQEKSNSL